MRRSILILYILITGLLTMKAQGDIKQKIIQAASSIKTMQCEFVQTKHMKMLNDQLVSKGKMCYQTPDKLRWEYVDPYTYTFILNGSQVQLKNSIATPHSLGENRSNVIDVNQNKIFKEIAQIMVSSMVGSCLSDDKNFRTSITKTSTEYVASMLPLKKQMKQLFQRIVLHFPIASPHSQREKGRMNSVVSKVELIEKNGDRTIIDLKHIRLNETIRSDQFAIR